jgi:hypothetical protein
MGARLLPVTALIAVLVPALACVPRTGHRPAGPSIAVTSQAWHFGSIKRGETVDTEIAVTNHGTDTLSISLYSTCDCLTAVAEHERITPGGTTSISLTYIGDEIKDRVTKTLYIDTNDTRNPRLTVEVTGSILPGDLPHMVVIPNPVAVEMSGPEGPVASLTITNRGRLPLTISGIRCFGCINDWLEDELRAGEKTTLQIELLPDWQDKRWVEIESSDPVSPLRKVAIIELE